MSKQDDFDEKETHRKLRLEFIIPFLKIRA